MFGGFVLWVHVWVLSVRNLIYNLQGFCTVVRSLVLRVCGLQSHGFLLEEGRVVQIQARVGTLRTTAA